MGGDCDSFCLAGDCDFKGRGGGVELKVSMVPVVFVYWTCLIEAITIIVAAEKRTVGKRDWSGDDRTVFFFNLPKSQPSPPRVPHDDDVRPAFSSGLYLITCSKLRCTNTEYLELTLDRNNNR